MYNSYVHNNIKIDILACVSINNHTYIIHAYTSHIYNYVRIYPYINTNIPTYTHACMHACMHTYIHTYIYIYIIACIHALLTHTYTLWSLNNKITNSQCSNINTVHKWATSITSRLLFIFCLQQLYTCLSGSVWSVGV